MTQNETVYNPFSSYFKQYVNRTESNEKDSFKMCLRNFALLYSRVGAGAAGAGVAGAGAASKFLPGAGAGAA
jgi:hypothetical protein